MDSCHEVNESIRKIIAEVDDLIDCRNEIENAAGLRGKRVSMLPGNNLRNIRHLLTELLPECESEVKCE